MSKGDYVSLEVAKLLKEKGFNELCYTAYDKDGRSFNYKEIRLNWNGEYDWAYSRPTLYHAQKWLRDVHNIDVLPIIREESPKKDYCCYIYKNAKVAKCKVAYGEDFYECMNDGLLEALKLI